MKKALVSLCVRTEQDFVGLCQSSESGPNVHRVASQAVASVAGVARMRNDQPSVDSGVKPDLLSEALLDFRRDCADHFVQFERGPYGPDRIVLMRARDPEKCHDLVSDELIDEPSVPLDNHDSIGFDPAHHSLDIFGIQGLVHCGVPRQIRKEHGGLATLTRRTRGVVHRAAVAGRPQCAGRPQGGNGPDQLLAMTKTDANLLQIQFREITKNIDVEVVLLESISVLAQAQII